MYAKSLREKLGRIGADIQKIIDVAKAENNRGLTSEEREKFHALETDYTSTEGDIKLAERGEQIGNDLRNVPRDQIINEFPLDPEQQKERNSTMHGKVFSKFIRGSELDTEERQFLATIRDQQISKIHNVMSTTSSTQGGVLVPQGFSNQLEEAKKWFGGIDGVVERFRTETGNPMPWPTINDTTNRGRIIGQNVQVTQTDPVFNSVTFQAYIGSSDLCLIPLALMQDSYFDMDALLARLLGTRLGRLLNYECTVGSGTNEPMGIVTAAVAAGSTNVLATGSTTSMAYNDLVNTEHTVDAAYRYNAGTRWMFSDAVLKVLKKLVDSAARPLWQPGLTASFRDGAAVDLIAAKPTILDHPYVINQDMAVPAANAASLLFGDMSCFKVREVAGGITLLRLVERYADYLQVGFIAFERFDSQLVDAGTHPIAVQVQSAT
jgi:HK97 family phage major capsid protein